MGEELLDSSERFDGAAAEAVDPKCPKCPKCEYDLRGLGAGVGDRLTCPECGGSFTYAEATRVRRSPYWREVSLVWVVASLAVLMGWFVVLPGTRPCAGSLFVWPLVLMWGVRARREGRAVLWPSLGVAACVAAAGVMFEDVGLSAYRVIVVNGVPLLAWAVLWAAPPKPVYLGTTLMLALIPGVSAVGLLLAFIHASANGHYWTNWNVSFPGDTARRVMGRDGALREGLVLLGATVLILVGGWLALRQGRKAPDQA